MSESVSESDYPMERAATVPPRPRRGPPVAATQTAAGPVRAAVVRALRILVAEVASMKAQKEAQEAERVGAPCPHLFVRFGQCQSCGRTPPEAGRIPPTAGTKEQGT